MGFGGLMAIDLGCRGAVVGLSLLIAAVLLRDRGDSTVARLGADPLQAEVPILTIALDTGFQSLAPFNRAFKMTPA